MKRFHLQTVLTIGRIKYFEMNTFVMIDIVHTSLSFPITYGYYLFNQKWCELYVVGETEALFAC